jgi:DNA-binding Lrp family transcriptional regulator
MKPNLFAKMENSSSNEKVKLTKNEQEVLKQIILKEKISDTNIAGSMKLSQQAVNQIRSRLETLGVIRGYTPIVDFEKLGIKVIVITGISLRRSVWEKKKEWEIDESLKRIPYIFQAYRVIGHDISHALMMGFADDYQRDKFIKKLESVYREQLDIKWNYSVSVKDIILQDPIRLLYQIIDKKDFEFDELFL